MIHRTIQASVLALAATLSAASDDHTETYPDPVGDAVVRRTDQGNDGPVPASLPDLVRVESSGWEAFEPTLDPFAGQTVRGDEAHLVRIDLVFDGLVSPPGTVGVNGLAFDPFRFGPTPLTGFVEFDIDRDKDTGGQLGGPATLRFLANAGRFGGRPEGSVGERAAVSVNDYDADFFTDPQFERSGEDFALVFCGCHEVTVDFEGGDQDGLFDEGEVWIVRSRFFQRAEGYRDASIVFGGSAPGLYDPIVDLRFEHVLADDQTIVSLVFPLDMEGAAALEGEPVQQIDSLIGFGSHYSVLEAVQDLINAAEGLHGSLPADVEELVERWEGEQGEDVLDPTDWDATALIGTAYLVEQDSLYVWTDIGFELEPGDFDGDGSSGPIDEQLLADEIAARDGGPDDADGLVNGEVAIPDFGINFSMFDVDGDGVIAPSGLDERVLWRFELSSAFSGGPVGVGADGTIYASDNLNLYSIDPADGSVNWSRPGVGGGTTIGFLGDGTLVTRLGDTIFNLDPADGSTIWTFTYDSNGLAEQIQVGPSVGPDGNIYAVTSTDGQFGLGALSLTPDGQLRWSDQGDPLLDEINAGTGGPMQFTSARAIFPFRISGDGLPRIYGYDFDGDQTLFVDFTCTGQPRADPLDRVLITSACGIEAISQDGDQSFWTVQFGPVNLTPVIDDAASAYSTEMNGAVSKINPDGAISWTSATAVDAQNMLAVSAPLQRVVYSGRPDPGIPAFVAGVDAGTGERLWTVDLADDETASEFVWSDEAALSPDGSVAYFTTRFTGDAPGALYAVSLSDPCRADLTGPGGDGIPDGSLTADDFFFYLALFAAGDLAADLTGPGGDGAPDGSLTADDFFFYLALFSAGCP